MSRLPLACSARVAMGHLIAREEVVKLKTLKELFTAIELDNFAILGFKNEQVYLLK